MIAVNISTYNNPRTLELCLLTLTRQTRTDFEIFIADDGSGDETRDLIERFKRNSGIATYHFWHPDQGYQKSKINNRVFSQLNAERYPILICIDHDVLLHPRFVEDHTKVHENHPGKPILFMGRRLDLGPWVSSKISSENVLDFSKGLHPLLIASKLKGDTDNINRAMRLDLGPFATRLLKRDRVWDLLGSNFSITTQLMKDLNGYNEDYKSYWGEDGDLFVRARNSGAILIGKIGYAVQWHLYHRRLEETKEHIALYKELLEKRDYVRCKNGIVKQP